MLQVEKENNGISTESLGYGRNQYKHSIRDKLLTPYNPLKHATPFWTIDEETLLENLMVRVMSNSV